MRTTLKSGLACIGQMSGSGSYPARSTNVLQSTLHQNTARRKKFACEMMLLAFAR